MIEPVTLAILAGGRGSRMGGLDKAALEIGGQSLLERQLAAIGPLAQQILVVANDDRLAAHPRLTVIRDPDPHAGVLPALLAALSAATSPLLLLLACDMPFVGRGLADALIHLAADHDAVVPQVNGFAQPMLAVYRVEPCRAAIPAALTRGDRRMIAFLDDVNTLAVPEERLRTIDPGLHSFFNVNTPDDLAAAQGIAAEQ